MYEFRWPTRTVFGRDIIGELGRFVVPDDGEEGSILVISASEDWCTPLLEKLKGLLLDAGWKEVRIFARVEPNPSWEMTAQGAEVCSACDAQAVLAIGGGSVLDAAKVIARDAKAPFLCTIPTTAGTGSEISPWAVITNRATREKESVIARWPDLALLDPALTLTLPPRQTLFTGLDAFIHGVEAFLSSEANAITDALALAGVERIATHLRRAVEWGNDIETRAAMMEGCLLTGAAMLHAGLGLMHAIGNVTGGLYHHLPHGLILAQCMGAVLAFNRPAVIGKYERLTPLVERTRSDVNELLQRFEVGEVEVSEANLPLLIERAAANVNAKTNPREFTLEELEGIVRESFLVTRVK